MTTEERDRIAAVVSDELRRCGPFPAPLAESDARPDDHWWLAPFILLPDSDFTIHEAAKALANLILKEAPIAFIMPPPPIPNSDSDFYTVVNAADGLAFRVAINHYEDGVVHDITVRLRRRI